MSTKDITLESVINIMMECLHSFQNDGDNGALNEFEVYRSILVEKVHNSEDTTADYSKVLTAFIGRLEESDLATSLEVLLVLKDLLVETEIPAVNYINDSMVMILRYLLSIDSHGVVTCTLDFVSTLVEKLPLFSGLYMIRVMVDKIENISLEKISLDFSLPVQPDCSYRYCKVLETFDDLQRPYILAHRLLSILRPQEEDHA